ncbi:hypothetical protein [Streptomyces antimycoticus]|uniref:Uncharacterized protein n=1 Tax=Streptomyces antimycoticus TaxID=68175 RepID=A0ABD5JLP3_9ACTN|nr:hypothetical protein [Streptomyces sp. DSM 41602]
MDRPWPQDDPAPPAVPHPDETDPAVLGALLARHGWRRRGGTPGRYARWTPPGRAAGATSLLVPESRDFPDSGDLLGEALMALSRSAAPSAREVLTGLAVPSDEIRWRREVPESPGGTSAWTAQERLRAAAHDTLLAAALAARGRAGYYGARHRRAAEASLERVLTGPPGAESGGRELTVFVPVEEDGRATAVTLLRALYALRDAADYHRTTGGMEVYDAAVAAGACRELTEAVVALVQGTEGARVALEWSPAAGPPPGFAARPDPVDFSPGDLPGLREAGARYVRDEPSVPVCLTGAVVRLRVLSGADVPQVRITLEEEDYRIAGHAHLVGLPIRVRGRLESRGGFRRLSGATGVTPVQVDEAERDRLVKSLQENLDFFEEACGGGP